MRSASSGSSGVVGVVFLLIAVICSGGSFDPAADPAARHGLKAARYTAEEGSHTVRAMTLAEALPVLHALAVANMANLLARGGVLLTNQPVPLPEVAVWPRP